MESVRLAGVVQRWQSTAGETAEKNTKSDNVPQQGLRVKRLTLQLRF